MRRLIGLASVVLAVAGCGPAADAPKPPDDVIKKQAEEANKKAQEGYEQMQKERNAGRPGG